VDVLAYDPMVSEEDMRGVGVEPVATVVDLIGRSDIVSIHAPLTNGTRGLLGQDELKHLKPGSYLVNTARYGIVAEEPLLDALRDGRLAGAAFDHFEGEFLRHDHPLISMQNVILTPHLGGTTIETVENHTMQIALALTELLDGNAPPGVLNPAVLGR
jgi:D-3-phosphoglycerate dehydrogenase / 2-oxoglutarate reductase